LSGKDYGALSYASSIIKLEDAGIDTLNMYNRLFKVYGPRGIRLYSLLRSQIFQNEILRVMNKKYEEDEIRRYIEDIINSPEGAIFISSLMTDEDIKKEIDKKLKEEKGVVQIFARAGHVDRVLNLLPEIIKNKKDIAYKIEEYMLGKTKAITLFIQKLKK